MPTPTKRELTNFICKDTKSLQRYFVITADMNRNGMILDINKETLVESKNKVGKFILQLNPAAFKQGLSQEDTIIKNFNGKFHDSGIKILNITRLDEISKKEYEEMS